MIRTDDRTSRHHAALDGRAVGGSDLGPTQARAAMPADVVEGAQLALTVAHHEHALTEHVEHAVRARISNLLRATGADPLAAEDALLLQTEDLRRGIPARGQRALEPCDGCGLKVRVHGAIRP